MSGDRDAPFTIMEYEYITSWMAHAGHVPATNPGVPTSYDFLRLLAEAELKRHK